MAKQNSRIGKVHYSPTLIEAVMKNNLPLTKLITPMYVNKLDMKLNDWRAAWAIAKNPYLPNRTLLYEVYDNISIDSAISSMIDTRIMKVQQSKFIIKDKNGKPKPEAKVPFEEPWFEDFMEYVLMSRYEGHSLIEFFDFDQQGHILNVNRVDKFYVKPELGIVAKTINEFDGWKYLEPPFTPFYISAGKKDNLGLLFKAAPHILAKKYALGLWSEFNEKIGIPFRHVHTNIMDAKRQQQLAVILQNMGSAGWAVLGENETLELLEMKGQDPTGCFDRLIAILDAQVALLFMGQSSTTNSQNNKGTYGSMQILQDISNDRHEADLTLVRNIINKQLIPRMIQFGYKELAEGDKLHWDKTIEQSITEIIRNVTDLTAAGYEVAGEFVTEKTGIPIRGRVNPTSNEPPASGNQAKASAKKKSLISIHAFYDVECCGTGMFTAGDLNTGSFEKMTLTCAKKIFDNKKKGIVDIPLLKETAKYLREAIINGYGFDLDKKNIGQVDKDMLSIMNANIFVFSGFKNFQTLKAMSGQLKDENGTIRTWEDFKAQALKLNQEYNINYLQTEYNNALTSAEMVRQWQDIQETKETLPYLQFDATLDKRTTEVCRQLDGITLSADDPFWNTYFLPLHWNERSVIRQVSSGKLTDKKTINAPALQPMFKGNVGKTGIIFPKSHPYYDVASADSKNIIEQSLALTPKQESFKKAYTSKSGGTVEVSDQHHDDELKPNLAVAKILADEGSHVKLLGYEEGRKNPDASIDGKIADFKGQHENTQSSIQGRIKSAAKQKVDIAVISLINNIDTKVVIHALIAAMKDKNRNKSLTEVWLIYSDKSLVKISRKDIVNGKFIKQLL